MGGVSDECVLQGLVSMRSVQGLYHLHDVSWRNKAHARANLKGSNWLNAHLSEIIQLYHYDANSERRSTAIQCQRLLLLLLLLLLPLLSGCCVNTIK